MGVTEYSRALERALKHGKLLTCIYCGEETLCTGDWGFCSNCEMPVYIDHDALKGKYPEIYTRVGQLAEQVGSGMLDEAANTCDALVKYTNDPAYLYEKGLVLIKHSNHETMQIRYDLDGFMEDNTIHRNNASSFASMARGAFIGAINAEQQMLGMGKASLGATFVSFLCSIKLLNIREASLMCAELEKLDQSYGDYARMVLELNLGHPDAVLGRADAMNGRGRFVLNGVYYAALAMMDRRRYDDAKRIGVMLKGHVPDNAFDLLMKGVIEATTI